MLFDIRFSPLAMCLFDKMAGGRRTTGGKKTTLDLRIDDTLDVWRVIYYAKENVRLLLKV